MKSFWKDVDNWSAKSKAEFSRAYEAIKRLPGWKFKGCPDGLVWRAEHPRERINVTARTVDDLIARVAKEQEGIDARAREYAASESARKTRGER